MEEFNLKEPVAIDGPDANEVAIKRTIFNLCLFLGHFGTKELGWLHPKDRERQQRKKKRNVGGLDEIDPKGKNVLPPVAEGLKRGR